ncbi:MAG: aminotransferase class I/II-fold pyridoxal phosphate-dependent enzyme, partial [Candidatus Omnitrophica bacterium]|nr:aminotransferase class I/II-fold pyridoxal phosphate-dependent enzyme [Candidatus Omnitrophota bacterium]
MKKSVKKSVLKVSPYIPGKPVEEVKRELRLKSVIKLASNENSFGPSPKAKQAVQKSLDRLYRYPDGGCFKLRKCLSDELHIPADQFIFGNGSDEVIVMAVRAFVGEGDEVVIAKPSFLIY